MPHRRHLDKKGFTFASNWGAVLFGTALLLSFLFSVTIVNVWISYTLLALAGITLGRFIYANRMGNPFPYYLLAVAIVSSYLAGHRVGNSLAILAVFSASLLATYRILKATS